MHKISSERTQRALLEAASRPGNDVCADCKARAPRWASYNIGVFICVQCAAIHRKIGTHVSKVKSVTLDSWTKEQVEVMKTYGNTVSNAHYNPDENRYPPPTNMTESERDSELEKYIRAKYEYKRFVRDKSAVAARLLGPSRTAASLKSPTSASSRSPTSPSFSLSPTSPAASSTSSYSQRSPSSASVPFGGNPAPQTTSTLSSTIVSPSSHEPQSGGVWTDLLSLQSPTSSSTLPLQFAPAAAQPSPSLTISPSAALSPFGGPGMFPTGPAGFAAVPATQPAGSPPGPGMGGFGAGFAATGGAFQPQPPAGVFAPAGPPPPFAAALNPFAPTARDGQPSLGGGASPVGGAMHAQLAVHGQQPPAAFLQQFGPAPALGVQSGHTPFAQPQMQMQVQYQQPPMFAGGVEMGTGTGGAVYAGSPFGPPPWPGAPAQQTWHGM